MSLVPGEPSNFPRRLSRAVQAVPMDIPKPALHKLEGREPRNCTEHRHVEVACNFRGITREWWLPAEIPWVYLEDSQDLEFVRYG
jgi:hypothetical protein